MRYLIAAAALGGLLWAGAGAPAVADDVEDFYKDRTVTVYVGSRAGGTYGLYARLLANHIGKHIPGNPKFIHKFDVRQWNLLGSMTPSRNLFVLWKETTPAKTIEECKKVEVRVAATGKTSPTYIHPTLMNKFLGTKFKVITGYKFGRAHLAMEQGEHFGINSSWTSFKVRSPQYVKENKLIYLVQIGLTKEPELPQVPLLRDLITDPQHKQVMDLVAISNEFGHFYYLPPEVPKDRVEAMRKAFEATLKDPELLAEAKEKKVPIEYVPYTRLEELLNQLHSAPPEVLTVAREAMAFKK